MKNIITLIILLFAFNSINANKNPLTVDESLTQVFYRDSHLQTFLYLSNEAKRVDANIELEILDAKDELLARFDSRQSIESGDSLVGFKIPFNLEKLSTDMLWNRLRYTISMPTFSQSGVISLSEIMPELFEIRAIGTNEVAAGTDYVVRVRTFHPTKFYAISDVKLDAELELEVEENEDSKDLIIKANGKTDKDGYATLRFAIPADIKFSNKSYYDEGGIKIYGDKEGLKRQAKSDMRTLAGEAYIFLNTDKPLYQPNQKISIRGLALESNFTEPRRKVSAEKELEFKISDEEDTVLYRETVKTSRFGIAAIEWQIPDNAKLGTYIVRVTDDGDQIGGKGFKVSRYELPNFVVKTKTDKDFYLPENKEAEVTIDAVYLFGKDVAGGMVKIVRESERKWNYYKQKWDIEEEETYEGETDKDGKYKTKIDLSKSHKELAEEDNEKFEDLNFTAYFTDSTTNITEQRRFDIRISKEAIHVYVIGLDDYDGDDEINNKIAQNFYITTSSADGNPLAADVEIKGRYDSDDNKELKTLKKLKTNRFGAAKASLNLPKCEERCLEDLKLKIIAKDSENGIGTFEDEIEVDDDKKQIQIQTNKTIYKKGEPIIVDILSTEKNELVYLDVKENSASVLNSYTIRLKNGRGKLKIPYDEKFKRNLDVIAYFEDGDGDAVKTAKGIIYPTPKNLRLDLTSNKEIYRPAEEATLEFAVNSPNKLTGENALGVFILDKAVEEKALTDSNFDGAIDTFEDFQGLLGKRRSFGGITQNDLEELDLSKPISKDIELAAEIMLVNRYVKADFFDSESDKRLAYVFREKVQKQFEPIKKTLEEEYKKSYRHPTDAESLKKILGESELNLDDLRDPWGNKYVAEFSINGKYNVVNIKSYGANKRVNKYEGKEYNDDFTAFNESFEYFPSTGKLIDKAVSDYYERTGNFVSDEETLRKALAEQDFNLNELKDRWGKPYRIEFGVNGKLYTILFKSSGKDKEFDKPYGDDFYIWTTSTDYFNKLEIKISEILSKFVNEEKKYPKDTVEFKRILKDGGIEFESLRDGWGNPYYIESEIVKRFADRVRIESVAKFGEEPQDKYVITPVTQEVIVFTIRSYGENGKEEKLEWRKINLANFAGIMSEQTKDDAKPKLVIPKTILTNGNSAIYGTIKDLTRAVIPSADLILKDSKTNAEIKVKANDEGVYLIEKIPAGNYSLRVTAEGFQTMVVNGINIIQGNLTELNISLSLGNINSVVEVVSANMGVIDTTSSGVSESITVGRLETLPKETSFSSLLASSPSVRSEAKGAGFGINGASGAENTFIIDGQEVTNFRNGQVQVITKSGGLVEEVEVNSSSSRPKKETPRLRNYFPETLLWKPEIITDANGKASIKFKLADNITTWKIYAIASNLEGNVGIAEKEIKAFQPFFVDLLPPRILTKGDEIYLPVQVRNYTEEKQKVDVEMEKADWFSFLDAETRVSTKMHKSNVKQIEVPKNSTQNAVFGFRAENVIDEGFQKVTAIANSESDAIEKPVTVKPDGKEIVQTASEIFNNSVTFDANFPANALPNTNQAEIKIYPNLFTHVAESVKGLIKRPYGCGEQTISSTYPNLMILKFTKDDNRLRPIAKKFLQTGYERLLGYQISNGGFTYWGGSDEANIALTAYAVRFLSDADVYISVDEDVIENASDWLISQQSENGSWTQYYYGEDKIENKRRTWQISTYVTRSLAMTERSKKEKDAKVQKALDKAFVYLNEQNKVIDEPYALANFGLALVDTGNIENAEKIAEKLESMAISEGKTSYWKLETNTPFYGWGTAGRIETTALVVQLLTKVQSPKYKDLISKGTMFLLKNKDRYGVWYSTQTTINVLDAFLATIGKDKNKNSNIKRIAEIFVNGQKVKDLELPPADKLGFPLTIRVDAILTPLNNKFEIKTNDDGVSMMAQVVQNHYISWNDFTGSNVDTNQSRQIKLEYACDKQKAKPTEDITCDVNAERVGYRGYGMLLAEIGIPPGADVDRASLEKAKDEDWSFSRYDVLPDRIIVYMWSKAGGTNFKFKFKPRYGINAQTPASFVYDYYNEEAKATVAPMRFEVK